MSRWYLTREEATQFFGAADYPERVAVEKRFRPALGGEPFQAVHYAAGTRLVLEPPRIVQMN